MVTGEGRSHLSPVSLSGLVSSSKSSLSYLVSRPEGGNVAVVAVGGAPEALDARPGALTLQVRVESCCDRDSQLRPICGHRTHRGYITDVERGSCVETHRTQ